MVHTLWCGLFVLIPLRGHLAVPQAWKKRIYKQLTPYYFMIHIGEMIKKRLHAIERPPSWLAKKINCDRTNVYKIFRRASIDTALLLRISAVLNYDFFSELSKEFLRRRDKKATET